MRMENAVPAIIDRETWERVQKKMEDNRRVQAGRPPKAREYPLKGKVFCRECKSAMTIVSSKKTYYYYACSGKKRTGQCDNPQIGAGELENIVADAIREILGNPGNIENIISIIREEKNEIINVNNTEFYADLAEAFLCDKDADEDKLVRYYECIVE